MGIIFSLHVARPITSISNVAHTENQQVCNIINPGMYLETRLDGGGPGRGELGDCLSILHELEFGGYISQLE